MAGKENEKILALRNQASIFLDDLTALVRDDTLAENLRAFSGSVMELKPGFAFGLKQAGELKSMAERTLKQYASRAIGDDELIRFVSEAKMAIRGESLANGGKKMGFLDKAKQAAAGVLGGKDARRRQEIDRMEQLYRETCNEILACEQEMSRCVQESRGVSPDSITYRNNERSYMNAKNKVILLRKQEAQIRKVLDEADRRKMIEDYEKKISETGKITGIVLGDEQSFGYKVARAQVNEEKVDAAVESSGHVGEELFTGGPSTHKDPDFEAQVAAEEYRHMTMERAGVQNAAAAKDDGFARQVASADRQ